MASDDRLTVSLKVKLDTSGIKKQVKQIQAMLNKNLNLKIDPKIGGQFKEVGKSLDNLKLKSQTFNKSVKELSKPQYSTALTKQFDSWGKSFTTANAKAGKFNKALMGMGKQFLVTAKFMLLQKAIQGTIQLATQLFTDFRALEQQLVKIDFVTNGLNMDTVFSEATEAANKMGIAVQDVLKAMESAGRAYQNITAEQLALVASYASLIAVVEQMNSEEAMKGLIATIKAYNLEISDTEQITDGLLEVSRNYAVDTTTLLSGLRKAAAAAKLAGLEMNDLAGVITAVSESTQESGETIGNSVKTIVTRLRTTASALREVEKAGIALYDPQSGQLKTASVLLEELNGRWETLSDNQKNNIAVAIAGKRQISRIVPIIENWDTTVQSASESMEHQGASAEFMSKNFMTIGATLQRLKNAFLGLGRVIMDDLGIGALIVFLIEVVTVVLKVIRLVIKLVFQFGGLGVVIKILVFAGWALLKVVEKNVDAAAKSVEAIEAWISKLKLVKKITKVVTEALAKLNLELSNHSDELGYGVQMAGRLERKEAEMRDRFYDMVESIDLVNEVLGDFAGLNKDQVVLMRKSIDLLQMYGNVAEMTSAQQEVYNASLDILEELLGDTADELGHNIDAYEEYIENLELVIENSELFIDLLKKGFSTEEAMDFVKMLEEIEDSQQALLEQERTRAKERVENIKTERDSFKNAIDDQIKDIKRVRRALEFEDNIQELTVQKVEIQKELSRLQSDDSLEAEARRRKLIEDLAGVEKEISGERADRESELREDSLNDLKGEVDEIYALRISNEEELNKLTFDRIEAELEVLKQQSTNMEALRSLLADFSQFDEYFDKVRDDFATDLGINPQDLIGIDGVAGADVPVIQQTVIQITATQNDNGDVTIPRSVMSQLTSSGTIQMSKEVR